MRLENDLKIQEACIQTYILPDQFSYIFQGFKESMFPIISKVVSIKKKECFFKEKNYLKPQHFFDAKNTFFVFDKLSSQHGSQSKTLPVVCSMNDLNIIYW